MPVLIDVTQDIKDGRYDIKPTFNHRVQKIFGKRIFVKLDNTDSIIIGNIRYTYNDNKDKLIIYVSFGWRRESDNKENTHSMIIKEYNLSNNVDLLSFMKRVRKELFEDEPQTKGFRWSFNASKLLDNS